jgi:Mrp family chromosome partitioning ATPase
MEKLQLALQKARSQRGEGAPGQDGQRRARAPGAQAADQLWAELPEFEPKPKTLLRHQVVTGEASRNAAPFDLLRTKTILHMRKNGWKRLAITSPTADCGKTVVACNLAIGMLRQPETRTLLIELDLRRPTIATLLGARPEHDISEVLTGKLQFEQQAVRIGRNVAASMATRPSADPIRYLLSGATQDVLKSIEARYRPDLMIFDMPPLLVAGGDTAAFLGNVDCALAVARAEKSTISQIDSCEREIAEHTNVLGVVLNQCRFGDDTPGSRDYSY